MTRRLAFAVFGLLPLAPVLHAQSFIDGRLLEQRGAELAPVTHCTVFARSIDNGPLVGEYPDDEGRFLLEFPPDARVTVGLICPEYLVARVNGRATPPLTYDCSAAGPCASVELTLEALAAVEGQVLNPWGGPVEGVSVVLSPPGEGRGRRGYRASSDDRGWFRLFHVRPGEYELTPMIHGQFSQGLAWEGRPQRISVGAGDAISGVQVPLELQEPVELTGRIQGLPPGTKRVRIHVNANMRSGGSSRTQIAEVDEEGRFTMEGLSAGDYQLSVSPADGQGVLGYLGSAELRQGTGELSFSIRQPGRITGVIRPEWPERDDIPSMQDRPMHFQLLSDEGHAFGVGAQPPDYRFDIDNIAPGDYRVVRARSSGQFLRRVGDEDWAPLEEISVREGETIELDLKVTLEVGRLTVLVRPPEGSPGNRHYVVALRRADGSTMVYPTDQNGKLVMRYFSRGDYQIGAWTELTPEQADDPAFWERAGDAVREFQHADGADMEITLTAAP